MTEPISRLDFSHVRCQAMIVEYIRDPSGEISRRACSPRDVTGVLANKETNCFNDRAGGPIVFPLSVNTNSCPPTTWTSKYFVFCRTCEVNRGKSLNRRNLPSASSIRGNRAASLTASARKRLSIRVRRLLSQPLSAAFAPLADGSYV